MNYLLNMNIYSFNSYVLYLKELFLLKKSKNARFSIRSMAKYLGLAPSTLSEVFSGKKKISPEKADRIADQLNLKGKERKYFLLLVQYDHQSGAEAKNIIAEQLNDLSKNKETTYDLDLNLFNLIADWYNLAIVELTGVDDFKSSADYIADTLNISMPDVLKSLELLQRINLLMMNENGKLVKTNNNLLVTSKIPNDALKKYHKMMLAKAIESIDTQKNDEKFIGSETFCFDKDLLPEFVALADDFFSKVVGLSERSKRKTDVYHLDIAFFNLCKKKSKTIS